SPPSPDPDILHAFMSEDHRQIEILLNQATRGQKEVNLDFYSEFRIRLLTHIKREEKLLFPAAQKAHGGYPLPLQTKLKRDHGAITALLVCPPNDRLIFV